MERVLIRRAGMRDLKALNEINLAIHNYLAKKEGLKFTQKDLRHEKIRGRDLGKTAYYIATAGSAIVGCISFVKKVRNDEWFGKYVYMEEFFVGERFRGRGIGGRLFGKVLAYARQKKANIRVATTVRNRKTLAIYRKLGFRPMVVELLLKTRKP